MRIQGQHKAAQQLRARNMATITIQAKAKTPYDLVTIKWEVDGFSGSTTCEAWRVQYELDCFYQGGYKVVSIDGFIITSNLTVVN